MTEVQKLLLETGARQRIAFIDACRNDPSGSKSVNGAPRTFSDLKPSEGLRMLYSTAPGQFSYEDETFQEGVFTHFLVDGLKGQAAGPDGLVTFDDVNKYITREMRRYGVERGRIQLPYQQGESSGDFLLAMKQSTIVPATPAVPPTQLTEQRPANRTPVQPAPQMSPSPQSRSGTIATTEIGSTLVAGNKRWRSSVDNQVYRMQFDQENLVIRNLGGQIVATLTLKLGKKGKPSVYQGQTGLFPANGCPGARGLIEVRSWSENRIDGRIMEPNRQTNGQVQCGTILGWTGLSQWLAWTWIAE